MYRGAWFGEISRQWALMASVMRAGVPVPCFSKIDVSTVGMCPPELLSASSTPSGNGQSFAYRK
jgi:hypothetical protein